MIKPRRFRHLPECETCLFYTSDLMLRCPIHPQGTTGDGCLDYRRSPKAELSVQQWLEQARLHSAADPTEEDEPRQ